MAVNPTTNDEMKEKRIVSENIESAPLFNKVVPPLTHKEAKTNLG